MFFIAYSVCGFTLAAMSCNWNLTELINNLIYVYPSHLHLGCN